MDGVYISIGLLCVVLYGPLWLLCPGRRHLFKRRSPSGQRASLLGHMTKSAEAVLISMQCLLPLVCLVWGVPTLHMGVYCAFHLGGTRSGAKLRITH